MSSIDTLIDKFVQTFNASNPEPLLDEEVPEYLRTGVQDKHGQYYWQISPRDMLKSAEAFQSNFPKKLPKSYFSLISRYAFPGFEIPSIFFFANTGENIYWELSKVFKDKIMSSFLIKNGFIQFGNPFEYNYDPVCFDYRHDLKNASDFSIVQLDHESILC
ncbi:MAG: hypothetical protein D3910_09175 [Candidatus Electrothrix sp. ATG2]|nr:hypothetical protein [Candidatus Electrothrix sp. ATG2]